MKIASWNVNSLKVRLDAVKAWLKDFRPEVLLLQELKGLEFPALDFAELGYSSIFLNQKSYNGVAILSLLPIKETQRGLLAGDEEARYLEAEINGLRIASIYLPNGNPIDSDKFPYKIRFMEALAARAQELKSLPTILGGDFNILPTPLDAFDFNAFRNDALGHPLSLSHYRRILHSGYRDAFRALHPDDSAYSFWDYQAGSFQRNHGLRIDHLLLSPQAQDMLQGSGIDKTPRSWERPSDHTPVWCELMLPERG